MSDAIPVVPVVDKRAWSISEFCLLHNISEPLYYKLLKNGAGPTVTKVGTRHLITLEDAASWMRKRSLNGSVAVRPRKVNGCAVKAEPSTENERTAAAPSRGP